MIAENRETSLGQHGANPLHFPQARPVISIHAVPKISRENRCIVWRGADELFDHGRQCDVQIAVKVTELEQAETIKDLRKSRNFPLLPHDLHIQKPPSQRLADSENSKHPTNQGIEGKQSLQAENPLGLVDKFRAFAGLALHALFKKRDTEALSESLGLGRGQRSTRPSWPGFSPGLGTW